MAQTRILGYTAPNSYIPSRGVVAAHILVDSANLYTGGWTLPEGGPASYHSTPEELLASFVTHRYRGYELLLYQADHDMRYLIPALVKLVAAGTDVRFNLDKRSRMVYCRIARGKHRWFIRDCSAMLPLGLDQMATLAGLPLTATVPEIIIGAYRALVTTLRDSFGVRPSITMGTTALHGWEGTLPEGHIFYRQREEVDTIARAGYFGGLTFVQSLADKEGCTYIDCNAFFAHAMRQGVPVRSPMRTDRYHPDRPGIYQCTVLCGQGVKFAFIPGRDKRGGVCYPRGRAYDTVLTSDTIELGRQVGYEITVGDGYVFEEIDHPFDAFINTCEELELEYRGKGSQQVIKCLRNSLYGKFGQRHDGQEYALSADDDSMIAEGWTPVITWDGGEIIDYLYCRQVYVDRAHMMPVWAMWITATARNMLARAVYALGPENCYYGDTDSIIVRAGVLDAHPEVCPIGPGYGQWKIKERFTRFLPRGKKMYQAVTIGGDIIQVTAGIPAGQIEVADLERLRPGGPPITTKQYRTERRAIHTLDGGPMDEYLVKQIFIPELQPIWADY